MQAWADSPVEIPLIRKLRQCMALRVEEVRDLGALAQPLRRAGAREDLAAQGQSGSTAILLHEGWAIRHRTLRDGRRQILDFAVPGDLCDPSRFVVARSDFAITAISPVVYSLVQAADLLALLARSPRLGAVMWWLEALEESFTRAHLVAVGRLTAYERVAYLLWELYARLKAVGLVQDDAFDLPPNQDMLADATGLSHVHVSRTLNRMQREGVIERSGRHMRLTDPARLRAIAQVDREPGGPLPRHIHDLLDRP